MDPVEIEKILASQNEKIIRLLTIQESLIERVNSHGRGIRDLELKIQAFETAGALTRIFAGVGFALISSVIVMIGWVILNGKHIVRLFSGQ